MSVRSHRLLSIVVLIAFACTTAVRAPDADAIRIARAEQNRAIAEGDAERVAKYLTEDVTIRRGLGPPLSGRDVYAAALVARGPATLVYQRTPADVQVSARWPLAFETGTWSGTANGVEVIGGRYSAQWIKREGRWLIRSELFVALTCASTGCASEATP